MNDISPAHAVRQDRASTCLPEGFQFTQKSLQDYVDCSRRFQLRYVLMLPWPTVNVAPLMEAEAHMALGANLHHLAHQQALGIPPERLAATIESPLLARWWHTFLHNAPRDLPSQVRRAEVVVGAPLAGQRVVAKYDLVAADPGERLVIVDWKAALKPPSRSELARRLQTRVYRCLAVVAGAAFNGGIPVLPEQVEMAYWFVHDGGSLERFPYDREQCEADTNYLRALVGEIAEHAEPVWPLTSDERRCRFCTYRSLCGRRPQAGRLDEIDDDGDMDVPAPVLEQIAEIGF